MKEAVSHFSKNRGGNLGPTYPHPSVSSDTVRLLIKKKIYKRCMIFC